LDLPEDLESLPGISSSSQHAKLILDHAISRSDFTPANPRVQNRHWEARWELAKIIDLHAVKRRCVRGYGNFTNLLLITTQTTLAVLQNLPSHGASS
jgi:hypothetical protein